MSAFLTRLKVEVLPPNEVFGRQIYILLESLEYHSEILGKITVEPNFRTDFASIPRIAWRYIDPEDKCILYPSVIHDWLYTKQPCTREQADAVLREAMIISGARIDQRAVVYRLLRMFGGSHWLPAEKPISP